MAMYRDLRRHACQINDGDNGGDKGCHDAEACHGAIGAFASHEGRPFRQEAGEWKRRDKGN
jgi:hypothetical protein